MSWFVRTIPKINNFMEIIAGTALSFIVFLTTADVVLRAFNKPILGTYEIVSIVGAVVIGFALPATSWQRGHIYVDFAIKNLPTRIKDGFNFITRCIGIGLFLMTAWNVIKLATDFRTKGEVTDTIQLPLYLIAYGIGVCFLMLSVVLFCDILKIARDNYE